jgi:PncC family amidohydrolase
VDEAKVSEIAERVGKLLVQKGWTLATAESCTGGLIGHCVTNISGSSEFYLGSVISYANAVKEQLLGIPPTLLKEQGAVNHQVALGMAKGVRELLHTDVGIGVTGIAGPTGGTPEKPVGTVFIAISTPEGEEAHHYVWSKDRVGNKYLSAQAALTLLEDRLRR